MTAKPTMYVANVDENGFEDNPLLQTVIDLATAEGAGVVAICAAIESEIAELEDEEKIEFLSELGQDEPGLNRVIRAGYELLGYKHTLRQANRKCAPGRFAKAIRRRKQQVFIHTDFERGFIRAETTAFADYDQYGGELGAKEAGKFRLEGKEYVMRDGRCSAL